MGHKHEFSALWWHFGRYGDQGVHVHSCFGENCDHVLIGQTRDECSGTAKDHERKVLTTSEQKAARVRKTGEQS